MDFIFNIFSEFLNLLPDSPFTSLINQLQINDYLNFINFFIPFDFAAMVMEAWAVVVLAYTFYNTIFKKVM